MSAISESTSQKPIRMRQRPAHWDDYDRSTTTPKRPKQPVKSEPETNSSKKPSSVGKQTIAKVFKDQGLEYTADVWSARERRSAISKLMTKSALSPADTKEAARYIECIQTMKDNASDVYAQAVEIRDVVFTTPDGASVIEKGLFATRNIHKGEVIGVYGGELLPLADLAGEDKHDYLFEFPDTPFSEWGIDGRKMGNFTRYMNHCSPQRENVSSVEFFYGDRPRVIFVASRAIPRGDQLLYDYGPEYWKQKGVVPSEEDA